jgi:hypothetical protein
MLRLFGWPKAAAILMTFDEDDFQKLVLNENGDIHETCLLGRSDGPKVRWILETLQNVSLPTAEEE